MWYGGNGSTPPTWQVTATPKTVSTPVGTVTTMEDFVTPQFYRRARAGEVIMTPMTRVQHHMSGVDTTGYEIQSTTLSHPTNLYPYYAKNRYDWSKGSAVVNACGFVFQTHGTTMLQHSSFVSGSEFKDMLAEVSTSVMSKIGTSNTNLWETIAEGHQAVGTVGSLLGSAKKILSSAAVRGGADGWLTVRYGLIPIMRDIEGIMKGLSKRVGIQRETYRAAVSTSKSSTLVLNNLRWVPGGFDSNAKFNALVTEQEEFSIRAMALCEVDLSLANNIGFTTKGLLMLPWELTNKSFVADWFVNLGDYFGSLLPAFGYKQLGSCYVIRSVKTKSFTFTGMTPPVGNTLTSSLGGTATLVSDFTSRTVGLGKASIVVKSDFKFDQLLRVLDASALIAQKIRMFR